jgi:hypothetical protein
MFEIYSWKYEYVCSSGFICLKTHQINNLANNPAKLCVGDDEVKPAHVGDDILPPGQ